MDQSLVSRIVGYTLTKGVFNDSTSNLPQRVAIVAEANHANQGSLDNNGTQITSAQQAGVLYGYGSPIYHIARILFPRSGGGIGGVPVIVYAQDEAVGGASKIITVTPSGTATGNATHTLVIAGRAGVDGQFYDINIEIGDTVSDITAKIEDAVNNVLGAPVIASDDTYSVELETKWYGLTADALTVEVLTNNKPVGIAYATANTQSGSGTPSVQAALDQFANDWVTIVINGYGTQANVVSTLEAFNGIPDETNPTGRYAPTIWKPLIAITGSVADNPSTFTDTKLSEVTIAIAPAPLSSGFQFEAAANMAVLFAPIMNNTPHLDVNGKSYPDMPVPLTGGIGSMSSYANRNVFVQKGCSTVDLVANRYTVQDFVTTYHPVGELPPQYRWCRNLVGIDFNVRFGYLLLEQVNVVDHVIANDNDTVSAARVIKPKMFKGLLFNYFADLSRRGLISDVAFSEGRTTVAISTTNPDRLEVFFPYKRTGIARIIATEAQAGFNFGVIQ